MDSGVGAGARGGYQSKALFVEGSVGRDWQARFRLAQRVLQAGGRSRAEVAEPAEREQCCGPVAWLFPTIMWPSSRQPHRARRAERACT